MINMKEKQTGPKLRKAFQKAGGRKFSDSDWPQHHYKGSHKTRFQYCKNSRDVLLYIGAMQGHTGGILIAPELMVHAAIPYKWKEFLFHRGCSYDGTSMLKSGPIAGGRISRDGRQTVFCTPLNPFVDNPDEEEPSDDLSKPRKVHYHSKWRPRQAAVFWIHLARAQEKGLQFWQTRSHAVIVHDSVPADCIEKVVCQKAYRTSYERLSTPRPAPMIVLKSAWQLAPHHCGDLEQFQASGLTFVGKFDSTAHSPFSMKLLVSARLTRVATTKPGSTLTLSNGATNNHTAKDTIAGPS